MKNILNLDPKVIENARSCAARIAESIQTFIDMHTTVSIERTVLRLLGADGVNDVDIPIPNIVVDIIKDGGGLTRGAAYWIGNAMIQTGLSCQEILEKIAADELDITKLSMASTEKVQEKILPLAVEALEKIRNETSKREQRGVFPVFGIIA